MPVIPFKIGRILRSRRREKLKYLKKLKKSLKTKKLQKKILKLPVDELEDNDRLSAESITRGSSSIIKKTEYQSEVNGSRQKKGSNIIAEDDSSIDGNFFKQAHDSEIEISRSFIEKIIATGSDVATNVDVSERIHHEKIYDSEITCEHISTFQKDHELKAEFHHLSGKSYLLILRHPCKMFFRGCLSVTPVSGRTSFLGFEFSPGMQPHLICSPKGISPLCLTTTGSSCGFKEIPKIHGFDKKILNRLSEKDSSLLIEPASGDQWNKLLGLFNNLLKFNPLSKSRKEVVMDSEIQVENDLGVEFVQPSNSFSMKSFHAESVEWEKLSENIQNIRNQNGKLRVMVFGGKGVGKSTLMRFLVNKWLSKNGKKNKKGDDSILFLDFDPGQSELVPPGCLSATLVSRPLLGPNYTHLKDPERMICVGDIDVSKCPKWYLDCASDLVKLCTLDERLHELPWFINTMGFCRGIGADLAMELIRLCCPTHVVQIKSIWSRRNFEPIDCLSWMSVNSWRGHQWNPNISCLEKPDIPKYSYHQIQSLAEREADKNMSAKSNEMNGNTNDANEMEDIDSQWGLPAWQSRDLCVLAYFSQVVMEPFFSLLRTKPRVMKLSNLTLSLPSPMVIPRYMMAVFNMRLVALCKIGNKVKGNLSLENEEKSFLGDNSKKSEKCEEPWENVLNPSDSSYPKILYHMPLAPCLGFGIVCDIDISNKELYLITPLDDETLASVDCLATSPTIGSIPQPIMLEDTKRVPETKFTPYVQFQDCCNTFARKAPRIFKRLTASAVTKRL